VVVIIFCTLSSSGRIGGVWLPPVKATETWAFDQLEHSNNFFLIYGIVTANLIYGTVTAFIKGGDEYEFNPQTKRSF
jgi:hypothetical protein